MIENKSSNNNIRKRINFDEPIADMIERLKSEHRNFETKLQEIEDVINNSNKDKDIVNATKIIRNMSDSIIHHAVEEEARLLRVIMHKAKDESSESIKIMQEHNWVIDFFKISLPEIEKRMKNLNLESPKFNEDIKSINEFVSNLRAHFLEEEQIVFPLVLKAENISS
ncbi:MAG TPA: hemerythrin domain-containing protein [Nitrososphaeraceae archaeon]|nr:hemerythrin domain-containing protein [Nitrososphaeraceae archaeon]